MAVLQIRDIYYDWQDEEIKHTCLQYFNEEDIKNSRFWNKTIHDEYAKKNAAFLFLTSSGDNIMNDIDTIKMRTASQESLNTRKIYREKQSNNDISWCIAAAGTQRWADLLFKNEANNKEKLWELIFDICLVNEDNPCNAWLNKMNENSLMCQKLTNLNIKELHYLSDNGTNFKVELPKNAIWCGGSSDIHGNNLIVNLPTEEVFTTPNKYKTNGIVYTSLPLVHSGIIIKDIMFI